MEMMICIRKAELLLTSGFDTPNHTCVGCSVTCMRLLFMIFRKGSKGQSIEPTLSLPTSIEPGRPSRNNKDPEEKTRVPATQRK